jgi:hypothetical protein
MAVYRLRAEYATAAPASPAAAPRRPVKCWHMIRAEASTALCGCDLPAQAPTRSEDAWGTTSEPVCHTCGALYLRQPA